MELFESKEHVRIGGIDGKIYSDEVTKYAAWLLYAGHHSNLMSALKESHETIIEGKFTRINLDDRFFIVDFDKVPKSGRRYGLFKVVEKILPESLHKGMIIHHTRTLIDHKFIKTYKF